MIVNALTVFHVVLSLIRMDLGVVDLRFAKSEDPQSIDPGLPGRDGSDNPDGLLIPVSRRRPCAAPRHLFSDRADNREPFDL
jgi:hypothetical protein